ncbi:hypothetical protein [Listeria monocytogenes]|uniref:hypothetical protein n=1 Tax=Listeria monocytogenes TaxID=1639 RepID=UPI001359747B|nr:hypothetical protein [Listeria monocytogenes]
MEYLVKIGSKKLMYINLNDLEKEEKKINVERRIKKWLIDKYEKGKKYLNKAHRH